MSRRADRKRALRILRHASAMVRERSAEPEAPPTLIVIDEAAELLAGRAAKPIRRELSRLAALGRSENVAVFTRADDGGQP
jgi:hypothetical protein